MLQREANLVFCDARPAVSQGTSRPNTLIVEQLETEVKNRSNHVITGLACQVQPVRYTPRFSSQIALFSEI
jgi:hypothetical protein